MRGPRDRLCIWLLILGQDHKNRDKVISYVYPLPPPRTEWCLVFWLRHIL